MKKAIHVKNWFNNLAIIITVLVLWLEFDGQEKQGRENNELRQVELMNVI
jgi:hypothetical protein